MSSETPQTGGLQSGYGWKVALAGGVLLGAGFTGMALAQTGRGATTAPAVIELQTQRADPVSGRSIAATLASTTAAPSVKTITAPRIVKAAAQRVTKPAAPPHVQHAGSVSPASIASAASPTSIDS
jgi:hypothetical protein